MDRSAVMAQLWDDVIDLVGSIEPDQWDVTVDWCPLWRVADLVSHLGGLQSAYNGAPQPSPPPGWEPPPDGSVFDEVMAPAIAARADWDPPRRLAELRSAAAAHVEALASVQDWEQEAAGPTGPTTEAGLFEVRVFDVWIHLQDLRETLGLPVPADDTSPAAATACEYVVGRVPWMFVKRVGAGEGDAVQLSLGPPVNRDAVVRVVNGRAAWFDDEAEDQVWAFPGALTLLVSGRGTPARWREAGALRFDGVQAAAFADRARLF